MLPFPPLTTVDLAYPMRNDIQLRPGRQGRSSVSGTAVDFAAGLVGVAAGLDAELAGGVATESAAAAAVARLAPGQADSAASATMARTGVGFGRISLRLLSLKSRGRAHGARGWRMRLACRTAGTRRLATRPATDKQATAAAGNSGGKPRGAGAPV